VLQQLPRVRPVDRVVRDAQRDELPQLLALHLVQASGVDALQVRRKEWVE
jgi:hypothetical protein